MSVERAPRAQWALARVEAARTLRHPALLTALLLYTALWAWQEGNGGPHGPYPVLQEEDRHTQVPLLLLAAGALVGTHLAATRMHRHGAGPLCGVLALHPWRRTAAHLLAALPPAALAAVLAAARTARYAASPDAVGSPSPAELATGPVVVLLAGCAGVALAHLTRSAAAGPLAVLLLAALVLCGALGVPGTRWWAPVGVADEWTDPLPSALMHRAAGTHLGYLAAVTGALVLFALVRAGARARALRPALALLAVTAVAAGAAQFRPLPDDLAAHRLDVERRPGDHQRCRTVDRVTFCAFPEFLPRTARWRGITDGVLARVPTVERTGRYAVRQRIFLDGHGEGFARPAPLAAWARDDARHGTPGAVTVGTRWDTDAMGEDAVLSFAVRFAGRVVGGPCRPDAPPRSGRLCGARAVTTLWLAAQATGQTANALRSLHRRSFGGGIGLTTLGSAEFLSVDAPAVRVVLDLLDRPADEVGARLRATWPALVDERTSTARAARLLGAPVPAPADTARGEEGTRCGEL
ncbi:ABC transporter permease [Streptomyces sp. NPDC002454]